MEMMAGSPPQKAKQSRRFPWFDLGCTCFVLFLVVLLIGWTFPSVGGPSYFSSVGSQYVSQVRQLGTILFTYASENDWKYPTGESSTEFFQELIDAGYLNNGELLYIDGMPGKSPWQSGKLRPENVCWDVVVPMTTGNPDALPQILSTGWNLEFKPGSRPTISNDNEARAILPSRSWLSFRKEASLVLFRHGNSAELIRERDLLERPDDIAKNFMPADLDPNKAYRQLKP